MQVGKQQAVAPVEIVDRVQIAVAGAALDAVDQNGHAAAAAVEQTGVEPASAADAVVILQPQPAQLFFHGLQLAQMRLKRAGAGLVPPGTAHEVRPERAEGRAEHAQQKQQYEDQNGEEERFHSFISSCCTRRKWGLPTCSRTKPATNRMISDKMPKLALPHSAYTSEYSAGPITQANLPKISRKP